MAWLPRREKAAAETRMSSIAPVGSIPYQPPVVPVQPVRAAPDQVGRLRRTRDLISGDSALAFYL